MQKTLNLLKGLIGPALIGLTLVALLRESELITVGRILDLILNSFDRLLGFFVAPIELLLSRLAWIFDLPMPERVWRYIFVCSIFMHLRSFQVEWRNPKIRWLALALFSVSLLIAIVGSYSIGLLGVKDGGMLPLICVAALMSLMEFVRNTIMGVFKLPTDRPEINIIQNLYYYHFNWTLGYMLSMLSSLPVTYFYFHGLTENLAAAGFFVLYIFIMLFLILHFLVGFFLLKREASWSRYRARVNRRTILTPYRRPMLTPL
jgi:hypothetical protein